MDDSVSPKDRTVLQFPGTEAKRKTVSFVATFLGYSDPVLHSDSKMAKDLCDIVGGTRIRFRTGKTSESFFRVLIEYQTENDQDELLFEGPCDIPFRLPNGNMMIIEESTDNACVLYFIDCSDDK